MKTNKQDEFMPTQIACDVKNCEYHGKSGACCAESIKVGPNFAVSSADTVCKTFKNK